MSWLYLALAIVAEVAGTVEMRAMTDAENKAWPLVAVLVAYGISFVFMTLALKAIDVGVVYAIWSGAGTAAVAGLGSWLFGERINLGAIAGMILIVLGVVVLVTCGAPQHGASAAPAPTAPATTPSGPPR